MSGLLDEASAVAFHAVRPRGRPEMMPAVLVNVGAATAGEELPKLGDQIAQWFLTTGFELIGPPATDWTPIRLGPLNATVVTDELFISIDAPQPQTLYQGVVTYPPYWRELAHALTWCAVYVVTGVNDLHADQLDQYADTGRLVGSVAAFTDLDTPHR